LSSIERDARASAVSSPGQSFGRIPSNAGNGSSPFGPEPRREIRHPGSAPTLVAGGERLPPAAGQGTRAHRSLKALLGRSSSIAMRRFAVVGASGLVVNQVLLWAGVAGLHLHYLLGAIVATQGSTTWNFLLAERWVFPHRKARPLAARLVTFAAINNSMLILRVPLLALLVSVAHLHYLMSNVISLVLLFLTRFLVSDRFIWKAIDIPKVGVLDHDADQGPVHGTVDHAIDDLLSPQPADVPVDLPTGQRRPGHLPSPPRGRQPVYRYDVGGFVAIQSEVVLRELIHFRTAALDRAPDISIQVGVVGERRLRSRPVLTHAPDFVAYEEHLGPLAANFRLDFADQITVTVGPLLARSPHVVYTNVVEALLRFVLVSRDRILLHSATIELAGRGVMLTARTDTGKTGTILRLLREQQGLFLSDDMTIVGPDGQAYSYPKPLTISSHTLRAVNQDVLSGKEQVKLALQSRLHSREGRAIGSRLAEMNLPIMALNAATQAIVPPPKYMVDRLVPCLYAKRTKVEDLFVIERGPTALEELDQQRAVQIMVDNTEDAYGFPPFRYFAPAMTIGGEDYASLCAHERRLLARFLTEVRVRRLVRDDFSWADAIPELLAAGR
jgi:dolichol-phosphate mannosyltransferase